MNIWIRAAVALIACALAGTIGWWVQRPPASVQAATPLNQPRLEPPARGSAAVHDENMSKRVASRDPFGLARTVPLNAAAAVTTSGNAIVWRFAALVVRGNERYLLMTAADQMPLKVGVGEKLPDGSRVKAIKADHAEIQGPRGPTRKIYLTEP
ncbi:hypothetical protein [Roseateles toxinivorans]|uniref:Uncharacterized protein n=1 Tax=Roseateles toxinivorans TaxID=270368 RepID=A0A4R6QP83_9BURK|nr:hypothetical protein [Roseateles toxinivorans]TDP71421.1 hypothetical protein DES47_103402 [Roseateles toxinivorans]